MRPVIFDLFSGAGGAGMGYHRAGFTVCGVDIRPQPRYPFKFIRADVMELLPALGSPALRRELGIVAIHASPPCQAYSSATPEAARRNHPDLIGPLRELLIATGLPWIIENVPGAPMRPDLVLCGCMFGLRDSDYCIRRERWFETSWRCFDLRQPCHHPVPVVTILQHGSRHDSRHWADPAGGPRPGHLTHIPAGRVAQLAEVGWMTSREMGESIPPAYTEHVGRALLRHLEAAA